MPLLEKSYTTYYVPSLFGTLTADTQSFKPTDADKTTRKNVISKIDLSGKVILDIVLYSNLPQLTTELGILEGLAVSGDKKTILTLMKEYTDGYAVQVNWESEAVLSENYTRAFCFSDLATGGSCWVMAVPPGHDSMIRNASYSMTLEQFKKIYTDSKNINGVTSKSFGTLVTT